MAKVLARRKSADSGVEPQYEVAVIGSGPGGTGWHDLVEIKQAPHDAYHRKVKRLMRGVEWYFNVKNKGVSTYYRNSQGDMPYIRPGSVHVARWRADHFPLSDYRFEKTVARSRAVPVGGKDAELTSTAV